MINRIDDRDYEILLHDISFMEGVRYIKENAEEVYYEEPVFFSSECHVASCRKCGFLS
jgi:hypothetical protein